MGSRRCTNVCLPDGEVLSVRSQTESYTTAGSTDLVLLTEIITDGEVYFALNLIGRFCNNVRASHILKGNLCEYQN